MMNVPPPLGRSTPGFSDSRRSGGDTVNRLKKFVREMTGAGPIRDEHVSQMEIAQTRRTMVRTLAFGLEIRDSSLNIIDHCTQVASLCASLARQLEVSEADTYLLDTAARLHEVGMFAVPTALLERSAPLTPAELEIVRAQAGMSAEIAACMHHPKVVTLIERQYADHSELSGKLDSHDLLLAGIFRTADVLAAVTRPRPYQDPLPRELRAKILELGAGTQFHPRVVPFALEISNLN